MAHAIEVSNLTKRFGDVLAVDDLSFTVDEGRIVGFLGPNGAGKTTTLRMLLGLVYPTAGSSTIFGSRLRAACDDPVHTVGAVLDGGMLHPGRTRPQPPARARRGRGRRAARGSTSCSSSSRSRTPRTAAPAATRSACASGSAWRPRCSATRGCSCSTSPPTAWTRRASAGCATSCARSPREGRAVLVSSHVLAEVAQTADDVVVINRGRSVAQGTLTELIAAQRRRRCGSPGPDVRRLRELLRRRRRATSSGDARHRRARSQRRGHRARDRRAPARGLRARRRSAPRSRKSSSSSPTPSGGPS